MAELLEKMDKLIEYLCEEVREQGLADIVYDAEERLKFQQAEIERLKKNIKMKNARLKIMKADKEYWRNMWLATLEENDD